MRPKKRKRMLCLPKKKKEDWNEGEGEGKKMLVDREFSKDVVKCFDTFACLSEGGETPDSCVSRVPVF